MESLPPFDLSFRRIHPGAVLSYLLATRRPGKFIYGHVGRRTGVTRRLRSFESSDWKYSRALRRLMNRSIGISIMQGARIIDSDCALLGDYGDESFSCEVIDVESLFMSHAETAGPVKIRILDL